MKINRVLQSKRLVATRKLRRYSRRRRAVAEADLFAERETFSARCASDLLKSITPRREKCENANCRSNQIFICKLATVGENQGAGAAIINSFRSSDIPTGIAFITVSINSARNLYQYFLIKIEMDGSSAMKEKTKGSEKALYRASNVS